MIIKRSNSGRLSLLNLLQDHLYEKTSKSDMQKAFYIKRRGLTAIRAYLFIYSLISLFLMVYQLTDYHRLFAIPYWSFALQTLYFGIVLIQSIKGRKSTSYEGYYNIVGILYELVFSFQFFNFLYFWLIVLPKEQQWNTSSFYNLAWLSVTVLSFIAIWIEQLFNMMKLHPKHILLVVSSVVGNMFLSKFVNFVTGRNVYFGEQFVFGEKFWVSLLLIAAPALHFVIGNKHYQHKKHKKNDRRKKLNEAIVSFKAVKDRSH